MFTMESYFGKLKLTEFHDSGPITNINCQPRRYKVNISKANISECSPQPFFMLAHEDNCSDPCGSVNHNTEAAVNVNGALSQKEVG